MSFKPMLPAGELDQLAEDAGTDKSSKTHDYMRLYEFVFAPYKDAEFCFMELGVGLPRVNAASLRSWRKFSPKPKLLGSTMTSASKNFQATNLPSKLETRRAHGSLIA